MENNLINIINQQGELVVSSREVAENFGKRHNDIVKGIEKLIDEMGYTKNSAHLFIENEYRNEQNNQYYKEYLLTRDGLSLLIMGFTGKKALTWKLKYIEAFNQMENQIKNNMSLGNVAPQVLQLAQGMQMIGAVVQGMQTAMNNMEEFVKDSINSKDLQIENAMDLIGLRARNKVTLIDLLKERLSESFGKNITAKDPVFDIAKKKIFRQFKVSKWEDISTNKFNSVHAYIDSLEKDDFNMVNIY